MPAREMLPHIALVLKKPKYAGNIGSAARCAKNMGISRIIVVGDAPPDDERLGQMATHWAADVVAGIRYVDDIETALEGFQYVVGTTARAGRSNLRRSVLDPRRMASQLVEVAAHNDVAILFGPEDRGLSNRDLGYCDMLVTIPTAEDLRSVNLSHAVMIICYELFMASRGPAQSFTPRLASHGELEKMYAHLEDMLRRIDFINPQNPAHAMIGIRRFFSRLHLTSKEVKIIRGICRQVAHHCPEDTKGLTSDRGRP